MPRASARGMAGRHIANARGARHREPPLSVALHVARDMVHGVENRHAWQILWRILKKNCRLRGGAPRSFSGSGVRDMFFAFLALPVEFSSLLITKNCYVLRFIS